jgi:hypothetical protein
VTAKVGVVAVIGDTDVASVEAVVDVAAPGAGDST